MSSTSRSFPMRPRCVRALAMLTAVAARTQQAQTAGWLQMLTQPRSQLSH